ncbi:unnamed protein product [Medioppia subpectinata]|uniref:Uncharacterized protein n=1 Tax=Medioppia subpectinata TaxID=1979941 RepID=A0A7R9KPT6_9ACAR|nr:unnamed protein product [Medioppia subpectinata]CAG2106169.1 unnamed protein product [Medioppia subpectinata]
MMGSVIGDDFCADPTPEAGYSAFNLADRLVIVSHYTTTGDKYWLFDASAKTVTKSSLDGLMPAMKLGSTFSGLLFAMTFKGDPSVQNIDNQKLNNLVIVVGTGGKQLDFKSYRIEVTGAVTDIMYTLDMPFGWKCTGNMSGAGILPKVDPEKFGYLSGAYDSANNRMAVVTDSISKSGFVFWGQKLNLQSGVHGHTSTTPTPKVTKKSDPFVGSLLFYVIVLVVILLIIGLSVAALAVFRSKRQSKTAHPPPDGHDIQPPKIVVDDQ